MKNYTIKKTLLEEFPRDARKSRNFLSVIDRAVELYVEENFPEYKTTICPVLVKGLHGLDIAGGRSKLMKLNLSKSEFANFQKLRYFGLAINDRDGVWQITRVGYEFLRGRRSINQCVYTRQNVITRYSEKKVFIGEVKKIDNIREYYVSQAREQKGFWSLFKK